MAGSGVSPPERPMNPGNIQHPASNIQWAPLGPSLDVGHWMLDVGRSLPAQSHPSPAE